MATFQRCYKISVIELYPSSFSPKLAETAFYSFPQTPGFFSVSIPHSIAVERLIDFVFRQSLVALALYNQTH